MTTTKKYKCLHIGDSDSKETMGIPLILDLNLAKWLYFMANNNLKRN